MADDALATNAVLDATSQGQSLRVNGEAQSGTGGEQTSNNGQSDDNIRKLQSTYDKKLAEKDKVYQSQLQAANQQIQQMRQQLNKMADDMAPDDYTRAQNQIARLAEERDAYANAYQQSLQQQQQDAVKIASLREILDDPDFDLVTVDDLMETNGTIEAMKLAKKVQKQREHDKQNQDDDKRSRNAPDVGSSSPRTSTGKWEDEYKAAQERRDSIAMVRLRRQRGMK